MSLMTFLVQTYDNNLDKAGVKTEGRKPLSVISHMNANAQLTLTISEKGEFIHAQVVDKDDCVTLIPVSENSCVRSSGVSAHPLCDMLPYIAGDYSAFATTEKEAKKSEEKYLAYITQLRDWAESSYSHLKVRAIYAYLSKQTLMADLIAKGIVNQDENGKLSKDKISGSPYNKVLARFTVLTLDDNGSSDDCWADTTLFDSYAKYYTSIQAGDKNICYVTGKKSTVCQLHPKGIVAASYGAKLLSSNDNTNFTYRGRFATPDEACTVSYEASQKAHSALTWLAANQSVAIDTKNSSAQQEELISTPHKVKVIGTKDKRTYICWNPKGKEVQNIWEGVFPLECYKPTDNGETFMVEFKKYIKGYSDKLEPTDDIIILSLDAATTGRLSVTYYNVMKASDLYDRLTYWGSSCYWEFIIKTKEDEHYHKRLSVPNPIRLVQYAFGFQGSKGFIELNDRILKEQVQRIYSAMFSGDNIPFDFVHALANKASNPQMYSPFNYENVLAMACAVIMKYKLHNNNLPSDEEGVRKHMAVDENNNDRSYLFGRLLAIAEKIELSKYDNTETREPNAMKLRPAFANHPYTTWGNIEHKLSPYYQKLSPGSRCYFKDLTGDIIERIYDNCPPDERNKPLTEDYHVGYYVQRKELNTKKDNKKDDKEEI